MTEALIDALCARSSRLDRICREMLADIPAIDRVEITPQPDGNRGPGVSLSFAGWSPSLHFAWSVAYEPLTADMVDEDTATDALAAALDHVIERQRVRARDADALGHVTPLRNGMVEHLQIDRAIAAIYLGGGAGRDLIEFVRSTIGAIHNGSTTCHEGGRLIGRMGKMVGESVQPNGTIIRYVAPQTKIYAPDGRLPAVFSGHHLRLSANRLPETVLGALVGRPLSALIEVHPELDGRTIRMAENDTRPSARTILVGVDQHLAPIAA